MKSKTKIILRSSALVLGAAACVSSAQASADYGPAIWRPAYNGHWYTSGYGKKFFVEHDIEGYYWSCIYYFQQAGTQASVHYAINGKKDNSSDANPGEVTQMVSDAHYAWHAACWNQHSMGTEHEGFVSNPAWFTPELYSASAALTRAKCEKYGLSKDRNRVIGHDQKRIAGWPAWASANLGIDPYCNTHTDPGAYWDWNGFMALVNPPAPPTSLTGSAGQRMKGDFNGDGREDAVVVYNYGNASSTLFTYLSTGTGFAAPAVWWSSGAGNWEATRSQWVAGDFNYDGKSDVAVMYDYDNSSSRLFVALSTGTSFQAPQSWWYSGAGTWDAKRTKLVAGDFNGFGVCDIGALYDYDNASSRLFVFLSTKTSFLSPTAWLTWGPGGFDAKRAKLVSGDFDGNGKWDIGAAYGYDNASTGLWVFLSQGSPGSSFSQGLWWQSGTGNWDWARSQFVSGDFNGDGKRDVAATYDYGNDSTSLFVFSSTGGAFNGATQWWTSGAGNWRAANSKWVSGDFSGDGKTDIGALYNYGNSSTTLFIFRSTASAFIAPTQWWTSGAGTWDWNRSTAF